MNLYKILFQHYSPKDSEIGIICLLLCNSDEEVYEWIASEPKDVGEASIYNNWKDKENEGETFNIYDDDYEIVGTETFKERQIRLRGEMFDDNYELCDLYYGDTVYGWELLKENVETDYQELIDLKIIHKIK